MAETVKITLYSHWLSSCSQRVRIALNLKGLDYEYKTVNVLNGKIFDPEFEKLNPVKFVPALVDGDFGIADSFAIILYLEDKYPQHPLLPQDLKKKALNIQIASIVTSSIQPLQNTCVILTLFSSAIEKLIKETAGKYATGDEVYLSLFPTLARLSQAYDEHPAFQAAHPLKQPDAPLQS
ncbi:hypothetical protein ZIOFF_054656 [Zingiber officinale]|uniref:glutathione transferase n=1 Tax=Zingiber officinale TaxID=94328 RepID=A0A8J5FUV8_ZINOF|nr:hypothetical protein ZIOFF_054656 [Zingiber officinale]